MPGLAHVVRASGDIFVFEHSMVTDLLIQDGVCIGALGVGEKDGEPFIIKAHSTILATGGDAQLFRVNFHPSCITGDGYAMGYHAGAELMNMEFMQVFPSTVYPSSNHLSWVVWEEQPRIVNGSGEEYIHKYLPEGVTVGECMEHHSIHGPFSTSDSAKYIEVATVKEVKAGRGNEHDACFIDINALKRISELYQQWFSYRGIDFSKEYSDFSVGHHCSNGGLRIDEHGRTSIPGLYAVGETATGPHGADRLGGSMMAFCQIFGRRAGKHAASAAKAKSFPLLTNSTTELQIERISELKERKGDQNPSDLIKRLQKIAWENLLVVRSEEGLNEVLGEINRIRTELAPCLSVKNPAELVQSLELTNLLEVGEMVTRAALMRTESRGGHYRDDFPERDDAEWARVITVKKVKGEMRLDTVRLDPDWSDSPDDFGKGFWG
jgi:succinate dehydrogenase/fumarate reductase flavoprotein subunit